MRKSALVTGGTGEIGQAICRSLAKNHHVIIHTMQKPDLAEQLAAEIKTDGGSAETICCDITDSEQTEQVISSLLKSGPIQIVVNNAGVHHDMPFAGMPKPIWQSVIDVTLNGFYNMTKPLILPMMSTRFGRIINISSVAALMGNKGQVNYAAAKSALHGASKSLAIELAPRGITVNVVAPGVIKTAMTHHQFPKELIDQIVPMKRAGTPEEVAALIEFLVSENAGYISGQIISINGAMI